MGKLKENETKSLRMSRLPRAFTPVGGCFVHKGDRYRVVVRDRVEMPMYACRGCAFASGTCNTLQACSRFDRPDSTNVWFKLVEE